MMRPVDMRRILPEVIEGELNSAAIYDLLSRSAKDDRERRQLRGFSDECRQSADEFSACLERMTGRPPRPEPRRPQETGGTRSLLKAQIPTEVRRSKQYRAFYLQTRDNMRLRRAFFTGGQQAQERALGILDMLIQ